jgi:Cu+-exporting ATPase
MQVTDVVCGMTIDVDDAEAQSTWQGKTFYFCSAACKAAFDADPDGYATGDKGAAPTP